MNDGQNEYHIPIFQMAVYHTVLPHQDLAMDHLEIQGQHDHFAENC